MSAGLEPEPPNRAEPTPVLPGALATAAPIVPTSAGGVYAEVAPDAGELRIDTDGPGALLTVSGVVCGGLADRLHWIAKVTAVPGDTAPPVTRWSGDIWYKDGSAELLPHQHVDVSVGSLARDMAATVRFSGGAADSIRTYRWRSSGFHEVEFQFDAVEGIQGVTAIDTGDHPNHPADLPCGTFTIEDAYRRAGFDTTVTSSASAVPLKLAGDNAAWSNAELHDAMQTYWSRFATKAQWALWILFAARHEDGPDLGGIMFDDVGPACRQGTAIFNDSFIAQAPEDDGAKEAWVRRMRFWTAVHEMGHAFNLCHSWQKTVGTSWIPLTGDPEVRSFMNYPTYVAGGQAAYFADFGYRFSDQELLFLRHAPGRFVEMGRAAWYDDHGFRQAQVPLAPRFRLELRVNRPQPVFAFLEPCMVELKLENVSGEVQQVGQDVLADTDHLVVIIKKDGAPARQWLPFAQQCRRGQRSVLQPGESVYEALFIGAGRNGWDLAGPGLYTVHVTVRSHGEDHVSNPLRIRILTPANRDEERLAQDLFTQDVGRVLAFDGSRVLDGANAVLREAVARLPDRPVARHALIALNRPLITEGKILRMPENLPRKPQSLAELGGAIATVRANADAARAELARALLEKPGEAAETLGHIDYKFYAERLVDDLVRGGDPDAAVDVQDRLLATLAARKVAPAVLAQVAKKRKGLPTPKGGAR